MSSVFDPGKKDRNRAATAAKAGVFTGGTSTGPGGITAGFDFSGGRGNLNLGAGSFSPFLSAFQNLSAQGLEQAQGGLPPELMELARGSIEQLGREGQQGTSNFNIGSVESLQGIQKANQGIAGADPFDLGQGISDRLHALSERRDNRRFNRFTDRLQRTGNLTSSVGTERMGEESFQLQQEALSRDLQGLQFGQGMRRDATGALFGAAGGLEQIFGRGFGEAFTT